MQLNAERIYQALTNLAAQVLCAPELNHLNIIRWVILQAYVYSCASSSQMIGLEEIFGTRCVLQLICQLRFQQRILLSTVS